MPTAAPRTQGRFWHTGAVSTRAGERRAGRSRGVGSATAARADRSGRVLTAGLTVDLAVYALSAVFAAATAAWSTLAPHRAWGAVAWIGYAVGTLIVVGQIVATRVRPDTRAGGAAARAALAITAWTVTALLPLLIQATERADSRTDRAQEEVLVIEDGGRRLLESGTPYLDRAAIAALPADERLLGYLPYQPGMAGFGVPRALDPGASWFTDARVWCALATAALVASALIVLRRAGAQPPALVRALQVVAVLPLANLTLATGGDDLPVLASCLLALALAATGRLGWSGLAVGAAAALKLFAWPVALVLAVHAVTRGLPALGRFATAVVALPVVTAVPVVLVDPAAVAENVLAFPFGRGLVTSPAASPLPGHLIATWLPAGRMVATGLLLAAGAAIALFMLRRPPRTAAAASVICGVGLLAATLLLPATRFGYLLYPAAFLVWAAAFRVPARREPDGPASPGSAD